MFDDAYNPEPGAAGPLVGKVYPLLIWVSAPGDRWLAHEKDAVRRAASDARAWIVAEATQNGTFLEFLQGGEFGSAVDLSVEEIPLACGSGEELTTWMPLLVRQLGYASPGQLLNRIQLSSGCDGMHAIVMVRGAGRSYAVSAPSDPDETDVIPVAACYLGRDGTVSPQTIAHELLHLHGAWDLYEDEAQRGSVHAAAAIHFPNDIMFRVDRPLPELEVGPLSRWRIGWDSKAAGWYDFFRPRSRLSDDLRWAECDVPPVHRSDASGTLRISPRANVDSAQAAPAHRFGRSQGDRRQAPRAGSSGQSRDSTRSGGSAPASPRRVSGSRPEELAPAGHQAHAYRELLEVARNLIDAFGVVQRDHWLTLHVPEPACPRPRGRFQFASPGAVRLWAAYDAVRLEQESLRAAIVRMRGAGRPLEMRIQTGFDEWKRAIQSAAALRRSGASASALAEADESACSWQRRVAFMVDTLAKRSVSAENEALITSARRFESALRCFERLRSER